MGPFKAGDGLRAWKNSAAGAAPTSPPPAPLRKTFLRREGSAPGSKGKAGGDRLAEKRSPIVHSCAHRQPRPSCRPRPTGEPSSTAATQDAEHNPRRHPSLQREGEKDGACTTRQPAELSVPLRTCSWSSPVPHGVTRAGCRGRAPAEGRGVVRNPPSCSFKQAQTLSRVCCLVISKPTLRHK